MSNLFLSPHFDDETLFGSFTICREEDIDVVICFVPRDSGELSTRLTETNEAMKMLKGEDASWRVLNILEPYYEKNYSFNLLQQDLFRLDGERWYHTVYAPMYQSIGGNGDHNNLAIAANMIFGNRVKSYATYTWPEGKTRTNQVVGFADEWIARKHRALSCYKSQIENPATVAHFLDDLKEYYAYP